MSIPLSLARPRIPDWALAAGSLALAAAFYFTAKQADTPTDKPAPEFAPMHYNLGIYQYRTGQTNKAVQTFKRAMINEPTSFGIRVGLANALLRYGLVEEATNAYEEAIKLEPGCAEAHCQLGSILSNKGKESDAYQHFQIALKSEPNEIAALNNLAWIMATSRDEKLHDSEKAVSLAERAAAAAKTPHPALMSTLAAAYAANKRLPDAIKTAEQAQTLATEQGNAFLADTLHSHLEAYRQGKPLSE